MEEISNGYGKFLAAVTGPVTLANTAKQFTVRQSPDKAMVLNNLKAVEAPFFKMLDENLGIIDKICRGYGKTHSDRQDLRQQIFCELWTSFPSFQGDSKISTWIYTLALRSAIQPMRRRIKIQIEFREELPERASEDPYEQGEDDQMFRLFHKLDIYEKAILMLMVDGYNTKEIGVALKMSMGTVNKRISRVRKIVERKW